MISTPSRFALPIFFSDLGDTLPEAEPSPDEQPVSPAIADSSIMAVRIRDNNLRFIM